VMFDHAVRTLRRQPSGEIRMETDDGSALVFRPVEGGWQVEGRPEDERWDLVRHDEPGGGFVLREAGGAKEIARTLAHEALGQPRELRYLLMGDGRLFRIALRGPGDCRFELTGWETSGAYLTARPFEDGWRVEPSPASGGIEDVRALSVMLAVEIVAAEGQSTADDARV